MGLPLRRYGKGSFFSTNFCFAEYYEAAYNRKISVLLS
jgi:hypothetical protein